jgi:histone H3/H4
MNRPTAQAPTIESSPHQHHETVERHPAYAQIGVSRVQGQTALYGSDFDHQHSMTISIRASELYRSLSRDWPFAREEYIQVHLSEAQWATFVSSPNQGGGVQCTLTRRNGEMIPPIARAARRHDQFGDEASAVLNEAREGVAELVRQIDALKISEKAKKELRDTVNQINNNLGSNVKFVAKQFVEHMERVTEHAKVEVNAYLTNAVQRAGLDVLRSEDAPIALPNIGNDNAGKGDASEPGHPDNPRSNY